MSDCKNNKLSIFMNYCFLQASQSNNNFINLPQEVLILISFIGLDPLLQLLPSVQCRNTEYVIP